MASLYLKLCKFLVVLSLACNVVGAATSPDQAVYLPHQRRALENPPSVGTQNISSADLDSARKLVAAAVEQQSRYNVFRVANPRRNTYKTRPAKGTPSSQNAADPSPPTLTEDLKAAAALVAEHTAAQQLADGKLHKSYDEFPDLHVSSEEASKLHERASGSWWPAVVDHGLPPMGWNSSYPVFRDVTAYGAKGDGVTDDTKAINAAIAAGGNCGAGCESSSVKGTFIWFPPGTYLISSPINAYYYSQLVSDPRNVAIIKTSPSFIGLGAIQSDVYIDNGNGAEWYVVQSNFYRQVRNLLIDITQTTTANAAGLHWQVGQATSVTNVYITASQNASTTQMGIFTENGSGGFMSDSALVGGAFGIFGGNQQYTVRNFQISQCTNASINLIWDWGWTWSELYLKNSPVGILLTPQSGDAQDPGSTYIMDTIFDTVGIAVKADFEKFTILDTSIITLDNVLGKNVQQMVTYSNGNQQDIPVGYVDFAIIGNVQDGGQTLGAYNYTRPDPPQSLLSNTSATGGRGSYFAKTRPQYEYYDASAFISVKAHGAQGNGVADDTSAIQSTINAAAGTAGTNVVYFPPGSYIITSTLTIPPNVAITGQVWSQLVASGSYFNNMANPKPMVQVGKPGDVGTVEISDMIFTSIGSLPGLILIEWNIQGSSPGAAGIWDSHFRIGGAYGTKLQVANCPTSQPIQSGCVAASMMLHLTPNSNGYFENVWAWVADHDIDDPQNTQVSVAVARGILVESSSTVWMYGTASEHSMLYQYAFVNSSNTIAGMMQTESPYFQGTTATISQSPGPFNASVGLFSGDPMFPDASCNATSSLCNIGWALIANSTTNLTIAGAGFYSWFDNYVESCVDTQNCQQRVVLDAGGNQYLALYNLITIGSVEMVSALDEVILAKNNTQSLGHPYWSALAAYLDSDEPSVLSCPYNFTTDAGGTCADYFEDPCEGLHNKTYSDFNSMQVGLALQGVFGSPAIPPQCRDDIALGTLANVASAALANYTDINDGYDAVYSYYQSSQQDSIIQFITDFMADSMGFGDPGGAGNKYFNCQNNNEQPHPCPPDDNALNGGYTLTYTPTNLTGFYNELNSTYGIEKDWVTFTTTTIGAVPTKSCAPDMATQCQGSGKIVIKGLPVPVPASQINITNPKTAIEAAQPLMQNISNTLTSRYLGRQWGLYLGSTPELLQAYSLPVFRYQVGLQAMANAKAIGQNLATQAQNQLIEEIIGAVVAVLPFVSSLVTVLEPLEGLLAVASEVGNLGLTAAQIQEDPSSAPFAILGLLGAGGKGEDPEEEVAAVARIRREDPVNEDTMVGQSFKKLDDPFQACAKHTCFG